MKQIIVSLLDTDLYKIGMQRAYLNRFTDVTGEFVFKCRNADVTFTEEMVDEINHQLDLLCQLRFTDDEIAYIKSMSFHSYAIGFLEFLRVFQLNRSSIHCKLIDGQLDIRASGVLWSVSPFEIYTLAIINEVYFYMQHKNDYEQLVESARFRAFQKTKAFYEHPFNLTEFGTRRRLSREHQDWLVGFMTKEYGYHLFGTSNVYLAKKYGIKAVGTFAHEYVVMPQGLDTMGARNSQRFAWEQWSREFKGALGICLSDTLGQDKFEKDFDAYFANLFTGLRHDSGDPIEWGERAVALYERYGIDPKTKTLMFSDSLDFQKAQAIDERFGSLAKVAFGIGTFLSNDTSDKPLNIVMKLIRVNGRPVAKLSNVVSKTMGDDEYVTWLRKEIL